MDNNLSIIDAAEALGVSPDTIRRRIKRGELNARKVETPQGWTYRVELDLDQPAPHAIAERALRDQIAILEARLRERDRDVDRLLVLIQQAHGHPTAAISRPSADGWIARAIRWLAR